MLKKFAQLFARVLLIIGIILLLILLFDKYASAERQYEEAYVLCSDYVNVRPYPNKKGEPIGRLEAGDRVTLDGKEKNGYLHIIDTGFEAPDGWIYKGFIVYDRPERMNRTATIVSKGRLAARKYVGGRRTRWLKPQASVRVYWWSDDWCVTNCGYVQSKYLELEGE